MGPETWRYLDLDRQGPFENASVMPVLARSVMEGSGPVAQTSVWGTTHLNVGWFDDVDATLDLARCDELGVAVVRRQAYGGGTAFYDAECAAMWGFMLPKDDDVSLDTHLDRFQPIMRDASIEWASGRCRSKARAICGGTDESSARSPCRTWWCAPRSAAS